MTQGQRRLLDRVSFLDVSVTDHRVVASLFLMSWGKTSWNSSSKPSWQPSSIWNISWWRWSLVKGLSCVGLVEVDEVSMN